MQFPPMSNLVYRCFKTHHNHSLLEQNIQMMINTFSVFPCYTEISYCQNQTTENTEKNITINALYPQTVPPICALLNVLIAFANLYVFYIEVIQTNPLFYTFVSLRVFSFLSISIL